MNKMKLSKSSIPGQNKKKKILLLSDDMRMHSGIATQSKEFVIGTLHKYDWVQIGGAVKHPEEGKIVDMGQAIESEYGIKNPYLRIYPISGGGIQHHTSFSYLDSPNTTSSVEYKVYMKMIWGSGTLQFGSDNNEGFNITLMEIAQ